MEDKFGGRGGDLYAYWHTMDTVRLTMAPYDNTLQLMNQVTKDLVIFPEIMRGEEWALTAKKYENISSVSSKTAHGIRMHVYEGTINKPINLTNESISGMLYISYMHSQRAKSNMPYKQAMTSHNLNDYHKETTANLTQTTTLKRKRPHR